VVRSIGAYKSGDELIAEIPYDGNSIYDYFDNAYDLFLGNVYYSVNCVYIRGEEQCESEYWDVMIGITNVDENTSNVSLYPNPTNGLLNLEGQGSMHISISNLLGQKVLELNAEDSTTLDLSGYGQGIYLVRIESTDGVIVQKVNVRN
jgi:hypothetical protein